jgi:hypothetical protein
MSESSNNLECTDRHGDHRSRHSSTNIVHEADNRDILDRGGNIKMVSLLKNLAVVAERQSHKIVDAGVDREEPGNLSGVLQHKLDIHLIGALLKSNTPKNQ